MYTSSISYLYTCVYSLNKNILQAVNLLKIYFQDMQQAVLLHTLAVAATIFVYQMILFMEQNISLGFLKQDMFTMFTARNMRPISLPPI